MRFKPYYIGYLWQWGVRDTRKRTKNFLYVWNISQDAAKEIAQNLNSHQGRIDSDVINSYYLKVINPLTKWLS